MLILGLLILDFLLRVIEWRAGKEAPGVGPMRRLIRCHGGWCSSIENGQVGVTWPALAELT